MTDQERWGRLESIFLQAIELPTDRRAGFLDEVCGTEVELRREVEAVLAGHEAAGGQRTPDRLLSSAATTVQQFEAGERLGPWEVDALLGRGGMGEVYLAHRADAQYQQEVAVKVLRAGRDDYEMMRRFRAERQILARLQHPNIATLLDGGVTEAGSLGWRCSMWTDVPSPTGPTTTAWISAVASSCSPRCVTPYSWRTATSSYIATSSRATSW